MKRLVVLTLVLILAGCTSASYKDASYKSLFKSAESVTFLAADGTSMTVSGSRSDVQAMAEVVKLLSP